MRTNTETTTHNPCNCHEEVALKLKEEGLKFSDKVVAFRIIGNRMSGHLGFPLADMENRKPKSGKPRFMFLSFCPFCGKSFNPETAK